MFLIAVQTILFSYSASLSATPEYAHSYQQTPIKRVNFHDRRMFVNRNRYLDTDILESNASQTHAASNFQKLAL